MNKQWKSCSTNSYIDTKRNVIWHKIWENVILRKGKTDNTGVEDTPFGSPQINKPVKWHVCSFQLMLPPQAFQCVCVGAVYSTAFIYTHFLSSGVLLEFHHHVAEMEHNAPSNLMLYIKNGHCCQYQVLGIKLFFLFYFFWTALTGKSQNRN